LETPASRIQCVLLAMPVRNLVPATIAKCTGRAQWHTLFNGLVTTLQKIFRQTERFSAGDNRLVKQASHRIVLR
jgi:hypothetical protein